MIPNIIHFVFGLRQDYNNKPFSLIHYIAIRSAIMVNKPNNVYFHCIYEPHGELWDRIINEFSDIFIITKLDDVPTEMNGISMKLEHQCDYIRLKELKKHGGIYLDIDTICIKPFNPLLDNCCVLGIEGDGVNVYGLCNGVILAEPESEFINNWIDGFTTYDGEWNRMAVVYPMELSAIMPESVTIMPYNYFHYPLWTQPEGFKLLFEDNDYINKEAYCHHLWESTNWSFLSKLSVEDIRDSDFLYAKYAKRFI